MKIPDTQTTSGIILRLGDQKGYRLWPRVNQDKVNPQFSSIQVHDCALLSIDRITQTAYFQVKFVGQFAQRVNLPNGRALARYTDSSRHEEFIPAQFMGQFTLHVIAIAPPLYLDSMYETTTIEPTIISVNAHVINAERCPIMINGHQYNYDEIKERMARDENVMPVLDLDFGSYNYQALTGLQFTFKRSH